MRYSQHEAYDAVSLKRLVEVIFISLNGPALLWFDIYKGITDGFQAQGVVPASMYMRTSISPYQHRFDSLACMHLLPRSIEVFNLEPLFQLL